MFTAQLQFTSFNGLTAEKSLRAPAAQPMIKLPANAHRQRLSVEAKVATRRAQVEKRHRRVRGKVQGSDERPRLAVFRSNTHIYAQVIDDVVGSTLVAASTLTPEIREKISGNGGNVEAAKLVGAKIAELCKQNNIEKVSFDRGGFRYHGRVQALADAAREAGLTF